MHRLGSNLPNEQTEHTWGKAGDTLESIVHQATFQKQNHSNLMGSDGQNQASINRDKNASYGCQQTRGVLKRMRSSDSDPQLYGGGITVELSARASAKDNDIPMVTWPCNEDSACHGGSVIKLFTYFLIKPSCFITTAKKMDAISILLTIGFMSLHKKVIAKSQIFNGNS